MNTTQLLGLLALSILIIALGINYVEHVEEKRSDFSIQNKDFSSIITHHPTTLFHAPLQYITPAWESTSSISIIIYLREEEITTFMSTYNDTLYKTSALDNKAQVYYTLALTRKDIAMNTTTYKHAELLACIAEENNHTHYLQAFNDLGLGITPTPQHACNYEDITSILKKAVMQRELMGASGITPYLLLGIDGTHNIWKAGYPSITALQNAIDKTRLTAGVA